MVIKKDEIEFLEHEKMIKIERVFLEKADKPSSRTGEGIAIGILMFTNKRLFFFDMNRQGTNTFEKGEVLKHVPLGLIASQVIGSIVG